MFFDIGSDPGERNNLALAKIDVGWMLEVVWPYVGEYEKSIAKYPNIKPGEEFTGYTKPK